MINKPRYVAYSLIEPNQLVSEKDVRLSNKMISAFLSDKGNNDPFTGHKVPKINALNQMMELPCK